jgi:hypothetical protein
LDKFGPKCKNLIVKNNIKCHFVLWTIPDRGAREKERILKRRGNKEARKREKGKQDTQKTGVVSKYEVAFFDGQALAFPYEAHVTD